MPNAENGRIREGLADLVLGAPSRAAASLAALEADGLLERTVVLAGGWRVAPLLRARVEPLLPDEERRRLRSLHAAGVAQAALTIRRSESVLAMIAQAGVECVVIKGIALIAGLYGDAAARMVSDLDLVVREHDAPRVERLLETSGYRCADPPRERHLADIRASVRLHNFSRTFARDGHEVDLHWQFGPRPPAGLDAAALLASAQTETLGATEIRVASPVAAVLVSVHHALRGSFVPRTTLKDAADLAAWWTLGRARWDLGDVVAAARRAGLAPSLLAMWRIVHDRDPGHPVAAGVAVLDAALGAAERREAAGLVAFFEAQLARGDYAPRTVELFSLPLFARWWTSRLQTRGRTGGEPPARSRPLRARAAGAVRRTLRIARELADLRRMGAFRALARAQRRYH